MRLLQHQQPIEGDRQLARDPEGIELISPDADEDEDITEAAAPLRSTDTTPGYSHPPRPEEDQHLHKPDVDVQGMEVVPMYERTRDFDVEGMEVEGMEVETNPYYYRAQGFVFARLICFLACFAILLLHIALLRYMGYVYF